MWSMFPSVLFSNPSSSNGPRPPGIPLSADRQETSLFLNISVPACLHWMHTSHYSLDGHRIFFCVWAHVHQILWYQHSVNPRLTFQPRKQSVQLCKHPLSSAAALLIGILILIQEPDDVRLLSPQVDAEGRCTASEYVMNGGRSVWTRAKGLAHVDKDHMALFKL